MKVKVGDVVAWADVPDGALVRRRRQDDGACRFFFYQRSGNRGWCVGGQMPDGRTYFEPMNADGWGRSWDDNDRGPVTVVALGLTGQETAADLQRLAEVFEVRDALFTIDMDAMGHEIDWLLARTLHALGWRPGMTAEDAARLLAAKEGA